MQFDGMTPQQAAEQILNDGAYALLAKVGADEESLAALKKSEARIAEACQHFYERGKRDAYKHAAEMALENDDFDDYYQWIEEQYR